MKIASLTLLTILSSLLSHAQLYLAEGINLNDLDNSTHFYDSGKGYFWAGTRDEPNTPAYDGVGKYLDGETTLSSLLGDLSSEIHPGLQNVTDNSYIYYSGLQEDYLSCWYQSGANVIEYWQQTYGVFAEKPAVSGYTYDQKYLNDFQGTQSLDITQLFYNKMEGTETGKFPTTTAWYLAGSIDSTSEADLKEGVTKSDGGYFSKYYSNDSLGFVIYSSTYVEQAYADTSSISVFTERLATSLGYTLEEDGSFTLTEKGTIASLLLNPDDNSTKHYITCYGFEQTEDPDVIALYLADSDDEDYTMLKIYAKHDGTAFKLYTDAEGNESWFTFGKDEWSVFRSFSIDTPESLKDLESSYSEASNAQIWSGGSTEWGGIDTSDDGGVATYASGWVRYASNEVDSSFNGHFYSKLDSTRSIVFNDYIDASGEATTSRTITLADNVSAPSILIDNDTIAYSFTASSQSITADTLIKQGESSVSFQQITLQIDTVELNEGSLELNSSQLTGKLSVAAAAQLHITGTSNEVQNGLSLKDGADIIFSDSNATLIVAGDFLIDRNFQSTSTAIGTVIVKGNLKLVDLGENSGADLEVGLTGTEANLQANLDLTLASSLLMDGALALGGDLLLSSSNKLTLDFSSLPTLEEGEFLTLFTDIGDIKVDGDVVSAGIDYTQFFELSPDVQASLGADAALKYNAATSSFYIERALIPEPSSATLTMLALILGLGKRRRRA